MVGGPCLRHGGAGRRELAVHVACSLRYDDEFPPILSASARPLPRLPFQNDLRDFEFLPDVGRAPRHGDGVLQLLLRSLRANRLTQPVGVED